MAVVYAYTLDMADVDPSTPVVSAEGKALFEKFVAEGKILGFVSEIDGTNRNDEVLYKDEASAEEHMAETKKINYKAVSGVTMVTSALRPATDEDIARLVF